MPIEKTDGCLINDDDHSTNGGRSLAEPGVVKESRERCNGVYLHAMESVQTEVRHMLPATKQIPSLSLIMLYEILNPDRTSISYAELLGGSSRLPLHSLIQLLSPA